MYAENRLDEALALVADAKFDNNVDALRIRADVYGKKGNYAEAIRTLDLICEKRPELDFLAHFLLGIFCFRAGDFKRSVVHYEIALTKSPSHPTILSELPLARRQLANHQILDGGGRRKERQVNKQRRICGI